jgi:hypothetical protein
LALGSLIPLIILGLGVWLWQNTRKVHELAIDAARQTCDRGGVQLLDGTVVLQRFSWKRRPSGRIALQRVYLFGYSEDGTDRHTGFVITLGSHIEQVGL